MNPRSATLLTVLGIVLLLVCLHARSARADPVLPYGYTCEQVRSFVNVHGRMKAMAVALEQGATWAQINAARRCLNRKPAEN